MQKQIKAFKKDKMVELTTLLVHFNPTKELILSADASPVSIDGVLSHKMDKSS